MSNEKLTKSLNVVKGMAVCALLPEQKTPDYKASLEAIVNYIDLTEEEEFHATRSHT